MKKIYFILVIIVSTACRDNNIGKLNTNLKPLWQPTIIGDELPRDPINGANITYNNNVLFGGEENGNLVYNMLDGETGEILWQWNDFINNRDDWRLHQAYQYQQYMVAQEGPRNYCIDLEKGTTLWKKVLPTDYGSLVWGIDDYYFIAPPWDKDSLGNYIQGIYYGQVTDGNLEQFLIYPPYDSIHNADRSGIMRGIYPFKDNNGDVLISMQYLELEPQNKATAYLGLYNFTKREWIYDRQLIGTEGGNYYVYDNKVYLGNDQLIICDLYTGRIERRKTLDNSPYLVSRLLYVEGILYVTKGAKFYALNPTTGDILWEDFTGENCSNLRYMDGVIYFTCTGDSKIHAIDLDSQQHVWHSHSPDYEDVGIAGAFTDMVSTLPSKNGEKGRVYTSSSVNGYCFEAAK